MNPTSKKRYRGPKFGDAPTENHVTLADEQLQRLLDKQLDKETTLIGELQRSSKFTDAVLVKDDSSAKSGSKSLLEFQLLTEHQKKNTELREHGLTDDEITLKIQFDDNELTVGENIPLIEKLKAIDEKIKRHQEELKKADNYANAVIVNRRELETDQATQKSTKKEFSHLIKFNEKYYPANDPVVATLNEYEATHKKKRKVQEESEEEEDEEESDDGVFIGPMLSNVNERVEQISKEIIFTNRISLNEIHDIERFKNYKAGIPNKTLYLKNLTKDVNNKDLARLFSRYYVKHESDVEYKIMSGRMRGQAFVTFKDEKTAMEALLLCNGYKLYGKPIIIEYGKSKT